MKTNKKEPTTVRPIKKNGYSSTTLWAKRQMRRDQADERQVIHASLSTEEKLAKIAGRPGLSKRESNRLSKQLVNTNNAKK